VVCGLVRFTSMALVNEVKRTGTVADLLVYWADGGMRKKVGEVWLRHRRGKQTKVETWEGNVTEGGTHSELMHSNIFAMKPMY